ncbi:hypothetical protein M5D96_006374, partial [Drosophila gunungcola]
CNYADTVDISHVPLTNGSYNYHGLQIPVHLTGIYDFEHLVGGNERRVKRHLRACVCKLRPCMRVCCPRNQISENGECIVVISLVCNILTIAVYLINRNRNMNFICYVICVTMHHLMWILTKYANLLNETCTIAVGSILWLFVVSHRTRKGLTSMSLNDPRYRFRAYSVYVWGSTTFLTAVVILTDRIWGNDLSTLKWTPSVGFAQCWLYRNSSGMLIFFIGPILVLCNINGVILILTIINMWKTERKVKKSIRVKLSSASQTYLHFLRIGVMMGVTWILDIVPYFFRGNALLQQVLWIAYYYHLSLGIVIFVLFVLKRRTLRILMKRLRVTRISPLIDV